MSAKSLMRGQYKSLDPSSFNGKPLSERTVAICKKVRPPSPIELLMINNVWRNIQYGVPISHAAQQVQAKHFREFDYILGSDTANMNALTRIKPADSTADGP